MKTQLISLSVGGLLLLSSSFAFAVDYQCTKSSCNYKWIGSNGSLNAGGVVSKYDILSTNNGVVISGSGWQQVSGGGIPTAAPSNHEDF